MTDKLTIIPVKEYILIITRSRHVKQLLYDGQTINLITLSSCDIYLYICFLTQSHSFNILYSTVEYIYKGMGQCIEIQFTDCVFAHIHAEVKSLWVFIIINKCTW